MIGAIQTNLKVSSAESGTFVCVLLEFPKWEMAARPTLQAERFTVYPIE
jgi:hypothetical protein